jgi:hypothetical protein
MRACVRILVVAAALFGAVPALAADAIGLVEIIRGTASRTAVDGTREIGLGGRVFSGDAIETGAGAGVQIRFVDESTLRLGENARVILDEMVYVPDADGSKGSQIIAMARGIFQYTSGLIAKANTDDVFIQTRVATIGIRGTRFLGGELTVGMPPGVPHYGFQINEGAVEVITNLGTVILDEPGEGTFLPLTHLAAPTPVRKWTPEVEQEAIDALAF